MAGYSSTEFLPYFTILFARDYFLKGGVLLHIAFLRGLPEFNRFSIDSEPITKQLRSDQGEHRPYPPLGCSKDTHINTTDTMFYSQIVLGSSYYTSQNPDSDARHAPS
jgi:hypothetical protein